MSNDSIKTFGKLARQHASTHNDGGYGFNPYQAKHDAAVAQAADARITDLASRFAQIRAAWNTAVAKYTVNGQMRAADLQKIEREVGVTRAELLLAKKRAEG